MTERQEISNVCKGSAISQDGRLKEDRHIITYQEEATDWKKKKTLRHHLSQRWNLTHPSRT